MQNHSSITALTLEGFQVFDQNTFVPLERLTLIFGPNSAGKSAVQDALELYASLLEVGSDSSTLDDAIKRHWRRTSKNKSGLAETMR
jgi:AAA15 family ATPase/GTPase